MDAIYEEARSLLIIWERKKTVQYINNAKTKDLMKNESIDNIKK